MRGGDVQGERIWNVADDLEGDSVGVHGLEALGAEFHKRCCCIAGEAVFGVGIRVVGGGVEGADVLGEPGFFESDDGVGKGCHFRKADVRRFRRLALDCMRLGYGKMARPNLVLVVVEA